MLPSKAFGAVARAKAFGIEDHDVLLKAIIAVFVVFIIFDSLRVGIFAVIGMAIFADATTAASAVADVPPGGCAARGIFLPGLAWTGLDGGGGC